MKIIRIFFILFLCAPQCVLSAVPYRPYNPTAFRLKVHLSDDQLPPLAVGLFGMLFFGALWWNVSNS